MKPSRVVRVINPSACEGPGVGAELLPERINLDPWGFPIIESGPIPMQVLDHARRAVTSCPRLALTLAAQERGSD